MSKIEKKLKAKIESLPPDTFDDLETFVDYLLERNARHGDGKLKQEWAGGLKNLRSKYTSLQLQKKSLEWRSK